MRTVAGLAGVLVALLTAACSDPATPSADRSERAEQASPAAAGTRTPTPSSSPSTEPTTEATIRPEPRRSFLSLPAIGLEDFPVVRYRGTPDDGPGTEIQNGGPMASPRGPGGGVGPGQVGNFIVTGHRTSHTAPFADLPTVRPGDQVVVESAGTVYVYEITRTRITSFRFKASKAAQVAPVPGRPGVEPRRPMITLSTCATPEDHARGNFWADEFGNPEHRIDKIGVLVDERPA
jgi:sortase A